MEARTVIPQLGGQQAPQCDRLQIHLKGVKKMDDKYEYRCNRISSPAMLHKDMKNWIDEKGFEIQELTVNLDGSYFATYRKEK